MNCTNNDAAAENQHDDIYDMPAEGDIPDWAWDIVEKHDLAVRTDSPLSAATVLLVDAADALKEAGRTAFKDNALSPDLLRRVAESAAMVEDAIKLATLCPSEATKGGRVTELDDGTMLWSSAVTPKSL